MKLVESLENICQLRIPPNFCFACPFRLSRVLHLCSTEIWPKLSNNIKKTQKHFGTKPLRRHTFRCSRKKSRQRLNERNKKSVAKVLPLKTRSCGLCFAGFSLLLFYLCLRCRYTLFPIFLVAINRSLIGCLMDIFIFVPLACFTPRSAGPPTYSDRAATRKKSSRVSRAFYSNHSLPLHSLYQKS